MQLQDLRKIHELKDLPILEDSDPRAVEIAAPRNFRDIAEAENTIRAYDLLHRNEYLPLAAIRSAGPQPDRVRVYFRRLCSDCLAPPDRGPRAPSGPPSEEKPTGIDWIKYLSVRRAAGSLESKSRDASPLHPSSN